MDTQKTGIIGGTLFFETNLLDGFSHKTVKTEFGNVDVFSKDDLIFIQRHGKEKLPPHLVNHRANIAAFLQSGVKKILSANSVGSLKLEIAMGSVILPHDYMQFTNFLSMTDDSSSHILPTMFNPFRTQMLSIINQLDLPVITKGIYFNTEGPRFETAAEISFMEQFADIVGMTMAKEAVLAQEMGIDYVALCSIDNYAHGISEDEISYDILISESKRNAVGIFQLIQTIIREINVNSH
ncbi:MAG: MTAP family purine nucleoside phosphorylase [Candidatus Marinimicrobia bacterium]|jgi:5'-methylthioadenosine phosphorylase|nr:MTAP family purine nucleoside phosphorylase [Candidatus Neomarinimicrobiota bacterium]MBT3633827.1 MTAP family purine nucleoside phosphorylase [Candidatus Neomarinimicrobiota bacterium]MBT3682619.1 MTAP family purine nucleoside phosphorylase [Candidatus Neomarinimicrobiota bacterium]MBT3759383.1 MTAP family purine nucleoside phosphorylase [Candidatus Neomarinimicrobiota bacterium]MBT3894609.1 MTAP family purine nucleoside phosphorylase [Candidatus Neomarinimicrobiota bacterium]